MIHIKRFSLLLILILFSHMGKAQTVTVKKQSEKIKGEGTNGYALELEDKKEEVNGAWTKFLKGMGKVKQNVEPITITEPALGGTVYQKGILYTIIKEKGEKTWVWIGLKPSEWVVNDIEIVNKELEKSVYQFGIKFYRDKIQAQIDEAQRASDAVEKQKQRLVNQTKDLNIKLGNNAQEKIFLDKSLEVNKLEHEVLLQKIENNKKSQDSVKLAGESIKKVIELHKDRQRKVN